MSVLFIGEVSSNHHQSLQRCFDFIDASASAGCDAVKFQLFKIDSLFAHEILNASELHRARRAWELNEDFIPLLANRCKEQGILFSCTPFYLKAVDILAPYVDFFKIASYELLWDDLLISCAGTGIPVILSTGMASIDEIDHAVNVLREYGCSELTLLHCVSAYPTPPEDCNLATIETLRTRFGCKVGWSDHSVSPAVLTRACFRWQSDTVEFHIDLDGMGDEFSKGHCWLPDEIASVIATVRLAETIDGSSEKLIATSEQADRAWRADPSDGLRPMLETRKQFRGEGR